MWIKRKFSPGYQAGWLVLKLKKREKGLATAFLGALYCSGRRWRGMWIISLYRGKHGISKPQDFRIFHLINYP